MYRLLFLTFFALIAFLSNGQSKGDQLYQSAKALLDKGDQSKAIKTFSSAQTEYLKEGNYYRYFLATQALSIIYQDTGEGLNAERLIFDAEKSIPKNSPDNLVLHAKFKDNLAYTYLYVLNKPESALQSYNQCIALYEQAGKANTTDIAFEFVNRAVTLYGLEQYTASANDMLKAISIYESDPETPVEDLASNYLTLGITYTELSEYQKALDVLRKGLKLNEAAGDEGRTAKFYNSIGNVYNYSGNPVEALVNYNKARLINEKLSGKESEVYAENIINIGNANKDMGDWKSALENYQEVLAIYQKSPPQDLNNVINLFLDIARITDDLGMPEQSMEINQQALTFASSFIGKNSSAEAAVYQAMAASSFNHGAFDESLNYNFKALSISSLASDANQLDEAMIALNIGQAYDELNDLELALQYKQKAIKKYTEIYGAQHPYVGVAIGHLGHTYELQEDYNQAIEELMRSLSILSKTLPEDDDRLGITYLDLGLMYIKTKEIKKGIESLEKAERIFDHYSKNTNKAKTSNRLALAHLQAGNMTKAEFYSQAAIIANAYNFDDVDFKAHPEKPDYLNHHEMVASSITKTELLTKRGGVANYAQAIKHLDVADELLKAKAIDLGNPKDRLELAELNTFFTEAGLKLMYRIYQATKDEQYIEKAFYYSERSKANELLTDLQLNRTSSVSKIPKKLASSNAALSIRLSTIRQQLASAHAAKNEALIAKLKAEEFDVTKQYEETRRQIASASPSIGMITNTRTIPTWQDVKRMLDSKTALVAYTILDSAKYVFIGTSSQLVMKPITSTIDIEKLIRGYTNLIKYQSSDLKQLSDKLTASLWVPVEETLSKLPAVEQLVIIPDGPLHVLPFESLGKETFLIEKYVIHYEPSAALLTIKSVNTKTTKPSLIALAPVFTDKEANFVSKSCQRFRDSARKIDSTSRAFSLSGEYINPLPATKTEVEKINKMHSDKGHLSKYFIEEDAREELIKKGELAGFHYIHLATHGFVNGQYPELSGLLLSQDPKSTEDGILYTGEIAGLDLKAELVTLSACETALGKKFSGEGVRGLTTAFLFAGAKTVVSSLWKVADESTSLLMIEFYNQLLQGRDKATALKNAKLSLIQNEKYSHPYYWAPFVQMGLN